MRARRRHPMEQFQLSTTRAIRATLIDQALKDLRGLQPPLCRPPRSALLPAAPGEEARAADGEEDAEEMEMETAAEGMTPRQTRQSGQTGYHWTNRSLLLESVALVAQDQAPAAEVVAGEVTMTTETTTILHPEVEEAAPAPRLEEEVPFSTTLGPIRRELIPMVSSVRTLLASSRLRITYIVPSPTTTRVRSGVCGSPNGNGPRAT